MLGAGEVGVVLQGKAGLQSYAEDAIHNIQNTTVLGAGVSFQMPGYVQNLQHQTKIPDFSTHQCQFYPTTAPTPAELSQFCTAESRKSKH